MLYILGAAVKETNQNFRWKLSAGWQIQQISSAENLHLFLINIDTVELEILADINFHFPAKQNSSLPNVHQVGPTHLLSSMPMTISHTTHSFSNCMHAEVCENTNGKAQMYLLSPILAGMCLI